MSTPYAGAVQQSVRAVAAWRLACFVLAIAVVSISAVAMHASGVQRTVLVPYGLYSANGAVKVEGRPDRDGQYLALLARADIATMLNWQPKTISTQLDAFLTRLSPAAYARYNLDLRNTATKYAHLNIAEVFYLQKVEYTPPNSVVLSGELDRYTGETRSTHTPATYTFHYSQANGVYAIDRVETQQ